MSEEIIGERIIQMDWVCRYCKWRNPGLAGEDEGMRCVACGHPKDVEEYLMPGDTRAAATVTDPRLLALAEAGENIRCLACGSEVRAASRWCAVCGADPRVGTASRSRSSSSWVPRSPVVVAGVSPAAPTKPRRKISTTDVGLSLLAFVVVLTAGLVGWWFLVPHKKTVVATVTSVSWVRVEHVEQRSLVPTSGWGTPPITAENVSCKRLQHGTEDCRPYNCNCRPETRECNCTGGDDYKCNPHKVEYDCHCSGGDDYKCNPHKVEYDCHCSGGDEYRCNCHDEEKCRPLKNGAAKCTTRRICDTCTRPRTCDTCTRTEYETCTHPRKCDTCTKTEYETCTHPRVCQQCRYTECDTCYHQCPVFEDLCSYDLPRWTEIQREEKRGETSEPSWPGLVASSADLRVVRDPEKYAVTLGDREHSWRLDPASLPEFQRYPVGARFRVEIDPETSTHEILGPAD